MIGFNILSNGLNEDEVKRILDKLYRKGLIPEPEIFSRTERNYLTSQIPKDMLSLILFHMRRNSIPEATRQIQELRKYHRDTSLVIVSPNLDLDPNQVLEIQRRTKCEDWLTYEPNPVRKIVSRRESLEALLEKSVYNSIKSGLIARKLKVSHIGLGRFGRTLIPRLATSNFVRKLNVYSESCAEMGYEGFVNTSDLVKEAESGLLRTHGTLASWLDEIKDSDLVIISSGKKGLVPTRGDEKGDKYENDNLAYISETIRTIGETLGPYFEGVVMPLSNPIGGVGKLLLDSEVPPNRIVSPTPDGIRAADAIYKILRDKKRRRVELKIDPRSSIRTTLLGTHSHPVFYSGGSRVIISQQEDNEALARPIKTQQQSIPLDDLVSIMPGEIEDKILAYALEAMGDSANSGTSYNQAPEAVFRAIGEIARFQQPGPTSAFMFYDFERKAFLTNPCKWDFRDTTIRRLPLDLPDEISNIIDEIVNTQRY